MIYDHALLCYKNAKPAVPASIKVSAEDFIVSEINDYKLTGEGEHLWLYVQKKNIATIDVATELAHRFKVNKKQIGYAGLKDTVAVTAQWFSIQLPKVALESVGLPEGISILRSERHAQKLKTGGLTANQFDIVVRHIDGGVSDVINRSELVKSEGFPNYFGEQRFGKNLSNLHKGLALVQKRKPRKLQKRESMYLSAVRSYLFNLILDHRLRSGDWLTPQIGEPLILAGSRSHFLYQGDLDVQSRLHSKDVFTSGALPGARPKAKDECAKLESDALLDQQQVVDRLIAWDIAEHRRALVAYPADFTVEQIHADSVKLSFKLPPGVFATSLLREIVLIN